MAERGRVKSDNPNIMELIAVINEGIASKKQISYKYFDIDEYLQPAFKYNGERLSISPYNVVWFEDRYYLFGYFIKHKKIIKLRIDRMTEAQITENPSAPPHRTMIITII